MAFTDAGGANWCAGSLVGAALPGIALTRRHRPGGGRRWGRDAELRRPERKLLAPAELGALAPDAMQNDSELAGNRHLAFLKPLRLAILRPEP